MDKIKWDIRREGRAWKASRERPTRTLTSFRVPAIRIATGHTVQSAPDHSVRADDRRAMRSPSALREVHG